VKQAENGIESKGKEAKSICTCETRMRTRWFVRRPVSVVYVGVCRIDYNSGKLNYDSANIVIPAEHPFGRNVGLHDTG